MLKKTAALACATVIAFAGFASPAEAAQITKREKVAYSNVFGDLHMRLPKTVDRIENTTTTSEGKETQVSGYIVEPIVEWKGKGPRPTVVIGRGTVGQGDQCAPSKNWPLDGQPDPIKAKRAVNLEGIYDWVFASKGVRVVVTDYIGMGTPGIHTYMNRDDQAHAMLDAARAAGVGDGPVAFYGHSLGGGASAAAVEAAAEYAPELNVVGAYASAPPADLEAVQRNIDGSDLMGAIGFTINGLLERYPHLQPLLDKHLNDEGKQALKDLSTMCTGEITDKYGHKKTSEWTKSGKTLDELLKEMPEAREAMEDQRIGLKRPVAPVMVISGRHDKNVEYNQAKELARTWCEKGAQVEYRDDIMPPVGEYNHFIQAVTGGACGIDFILKRFRGEPLGRTCEAPVGQLQGSVEGSAALPNVAGS
ncbi:alpha/beta fold hydrolase [Corynebacterium sp. c24Ua_83]|uniref:alpha/beta fold hydrolase n=1 Tax=Corynebacterium sp. c24Ua_83 TaxID=3032350 RepID=UPI003265B4E0